LGFKASSWENTEGAQQELVRPFEMPREVQVYRLIHIPTVKREGTVPSKMLRARTLSCRQSLSVTGPWKTVERGD